MKPQDQHPDPRQLEAFALGRARGLENRVIETHLLDCALCASFVETIPDDQLIKSLRRSSP